MYPLSEPPSAPRDLKVTKVDGDHMTLAWKPPSSDGGAPIRRFIIEQRTPEETEYRPIGKVDGKTCQYEVEGLQVGSAYEFRVKAENPAGPSESGAELKKPVVAKYPFGKEHEN